MACFCSSVLLRIAQNKIPEPGQGAPNQTGYNGAYFNPPPNPGSRNYAPEPVPGGPQGQQQQAGYGGAQGGPGFQRLQQYKQQQNYGPPHNPAYGAGGAGAGYGSPSRAAQLEDEYGNGGGGSGFRGGGNDYDEYGADAGGGQQQQEERTESDEEVEAIKQQMRFTKQESLSATRNALRMAREAEETATNSMMRLGDQSGELQMFVRTCPRVITDIGAAAIDHQQRNLPTRNAIWICQKRTPLVQTTTQRIS